MTRTAGRRLGPWLTLLFAAAEVALVTSGLLAIRTAVVVGVAVEVVLWLTAISRVLVAVRRYRSGRAEGLDAWAAAEDGLAQVVPRPLARLLLVEPRLAVCLVGWVIGRHEGRLPGAFSYGKSIRPLLGTVLALVVLEGAMAEALLAVMLPHTPWVWIALGVHCYALVWLAGFYASLVTRPHRLGSDGLVVRDGIFTELVIPYRAIAQARIVLSSNFGRSGLKVDPTTRIATLAYGDANVALDLDADQPIPVASTRTALHLAILCITVDDPPRFVAALHERTSTQSVLPVVRGARRGDVGGDPLEEDVDQSRATGNTSGPWGTESASSSASV